MSEGIALEEQQERAVQTCRHHWIIETPNGATSLGVCKRCGATKHFPNAAEDALWEAGDLAVGRWSSGRGAIGPAEISLQDSIEDAL